MTLTFSDVLRKKILYSLFFLSALSVFQTKPEVPDISFVTTLGKQVAIALLSMFVSFGCVYLIGRILIGNVQDEVRPLGRENAMRDLVLNGHEVFAGELHPGFRLILNILNRCSSVDDLQQKRTILKQYHSNFIRPPEYPRSFKTGDEWLSWLKAPAFKPGVFTFHGPAGAGKNHSVKWLKHELDKEERLKNIPFVFMTEVETSLVAGGVHTLEESFKKLAKRARDTKHLVAICVFDELTSLVPERIIQLGPDKTIDYLLKKLDGFESTDSEPDDVPVSIIIIGLTNFLTHLDRAFKDRCGFFEFRYDEKLLNEIAVQKFGNDFLEACSPLRECLKHGYKFRETGNQISPRYLESFKKTMFGRATINYADKKVDIPYANFIEIPLQEKLTLFEDCFELRDDDNNQGSKILCQRF